MSPFLALFGHGAMSDLSPLSRVKRKSDLGAAMSVDDPTETSARISGSSNEARFRPYESARLRRTLLPIERGANMRRREFLGILGSSVAVWPLAARAQRAALGCHELVEGGLNVNR